MFLPTSQELEPGTYVSVKVLGPTKGQSKFKPGFVVLSSFKGGRRVQNLDTGATIRVNKANVRLIPMPKEL